MNDKQSINDWSEYLIWAEKHMKDLEDKLLHKNYDMEQIRNHADRIVWSIDKCVVWAEKQKK